jgi:predicted PurR-regulated permease PerM
MKEIQQRPIQSYVFAGILVLLLLAVFRLFTPFFTPLLWSILLYIIFSPLHHRLIKTFDHKTLKGKILCRLWAGVFTLGTLVLIIFPLSFILRLFFLQIQEMVRHLLNFLNERPYYIHELLERVSGFISDVSAEQSVITANDIEEQIVIFLVNIMQNAVAQSTNIFQNIGSFAFNILIMMFSMFFFYVDGPYLSQLVWKAVPIKKEYISTLTNKFKDITRNLFLGYIIVALLQSIVALIIFNIFNIRGSLVLAAITFILVFIPMFGATIIYIPIAIVMIVSGRIAAGIIFLIVSIIFISGIDNILRPFFLKDRIQLHPLIIFFAILGGLFVFGFNGFVLGPVLVILFLTVLDLFLTEHKLSNQSNKENNVKKEKQEPE